MITYEVATYQVGDKTVEVTFTDDGGFVHKRNVNIPYNSDGTIDEDYLQEIFEGQLRGVENKIRVGVITFTDPNEYVGIAST
jgi:dUTPase